ncbi:type III-B CRISPR module-associated Cmr3 family protein [Thermocrinis sp.]
MKFLWLKAVDVLSFGTLKNFTAGEAHYQHLDFPPPIMRFFSLGKTLKVMGVFLAKGEELYAPIPADTLTERKAKSGEALVPEFHQTLKRPFFLPKEGKLLSLEQAKGFCSLKDIFEKYAEGQPFEIKEQGIKFEERTGISLNYDLRIAEEKYLYSRIFVRLSDYSIVLLVEGEWDKIEYSTVGGERRMARLKEGDIPWLKDKLSQKVSIDRGKLYKFYATTHLHFDPNKELSLNGLKFGIDWISSQEPEYVSGFKKPFLYMLKPGTVLWLRAKEDGIVKRLCQISVKNGVINLTDRGWNSGIVLEVEK